MSKLRAVEDIGSESLHTIRGVPGQEKLPKDNIQKETSALIRRNTILNNLPSLVSPWKPLPV